MGSVNGDPRPGRSKRFGDHSINRTAEPETAPDSLPYTGDDEVHSSPRRTTSRRLRRSSSYRTVDQNDYSASTMPPPSGATLARAARDAYRRPVNCLAPGERYEVPQRTHSTRNVSLGYGKTRVVDEYSGQSNAENELAYGGSGDDDDEHIEVVEEVEEEPARYRERRQPSRDEYMDSSSDRRYHRRRRRAYADEDKGPMRPYAASDGGSAAYASSRTLDRSVESRQGRRGHGADVIEDSRPPVSSKRSQVHKRHKSAEVIQIDQPRLRRSSTVRSTGGRSGIIGTIFGAPLGRQESVKQARAPKRRVECIICMGDINPAKISTLKCGHSMCRPCLERIFKLSMTDPRHMPPRCCTQDHIPLKHVDRIFDSAFKKAWNRKFAEYSTKNRIYCPSRKCGEWIKPAYIRREDGRKVARCGRCRTKVCCSCSGRWHGPGSCPGDPETANLLAQAKEEGWKRCYKCKVLVELKEGCNHMTCRCGAEFCMICGVKWKNCDCPWFNDNDRRGDFLDDVNIPVPHIRGDLGDIFHEDRPPSPVELRGHTGLGHPMVMPVRRRPRTYQEEMHMRRVQESRDSDMARHLQYSDDYYDEPNMMGGVGDIHGIGNASGHHMNENYRRGGGGRYRPCPPAQYDRTDYGDAYRSRGFRVETSQERRLADRMAESRSGMGSPPSTGPIYPIGMMPAAPPPPVPAAPQGQPPTRPLRHHSMEAEMYNKSPYTPRSERVVGGRMTRDCEDEAELHASPPRNRRHGTKSSDLAGLSGPGSGMNRVSQWRAYVEAGVPDGESTVGHA
ncbi:hypothetical protein C2857_007336 [Epichloe festucae Fl1]|uniref:RBR-type E3 ubiquitin transferase n=1 Tax=Epichloe festucae (strain Fl1) TaxID=877507 RepID=A0A7S9KMA4_EPIFF|nr:hypothetical protein C2857_007336 [Epichloe festucae Fl1]